MNLVYSLITFAYLALGSIINPLYTNSSATTYIATSTSLAANNALTGTNSTIINFPIRLKSWLRLDYKHDKLNVSPTAGWL